jgi:hypothetical protein
VCDFEQDANADHGRTVLVDQEGNETAKLPTDKQVVATTGLHPDGYVSGIGKFCNSPM